MNIEKMREEFEAWYLAEYFDGDKECGLEWLSTEPCGGYRYERPCTQWKIWQASRAAIEVELPQRWEFNAFGDPQKSDSGTELEYLEVVKSIESLGLKVKS